MLPMMERVLMSGKSYGWCFRKLPTVAGICLWLQGYYRWTACKTGLLQVDGTGNQFAVERSITPRLIRHDFPGCATIATQ